VSLDLCNASCIQQLDKHRVSTEEKNQALEQKDIRETPKYNSQPSRSFVIEECAKNKFTNIPFLVHYAKIFNTYPFLIKDVHFGYKIQFFVAEISA
jgi:predicted oxidoreductase (fatty acid repression mutant protein)